MGSTELIVVSAIIAIFVGWHLTIGQRTRNAAILNKMYLKIILPARVDALRSHRSNF